jgi:hypothetical protein
MHFVYQDIDWLYDILKNIAYGKKDDGQRAEAKEQNDMGLFSHFMKQLVGGNLQKKVPVQRLDGFIYDVILPGFVYSRSLPVPDQTGHGIRMFYGGTCRPEDLITFVGIEIDALRGAADITIQPEVLQIEPKDQKTDFLHVVSVADHPMKVNIIYNPVLCIQITFHLWIFSRSIVHFVHGYQPGGILFDAAAGDIQTGLLSGKAKGHHIQFRPRQ